MISGSSTFRKYIAGYDLDPLPLEGLLPCMVYGSSIFRKCIAWSSIFRQYIYIYIYIYMSMWGWGFHMPNCSSMVDPRSFIWLYFTIHCYIHPQICIWGVWSCIWVSGLVFLVSGPGFWVSGLVFGCLDLHLG